MLRVIFVYADNLRSILQYRHKHANGSAETKKISNLTQVYAQTWIYPARFSHLAEVCNPVIIYMNNNEAFWSYSQNPFINLLHYITKLYFNFLDTLSIALFYSKTLPRSFQRGIFSTGHANRWMSTSRSYLQLQSLVTTTSIPTNILFGKGHNSLKENQ